MTPEFQTTRVSSAVEKLLSRLPFAEEHAGNGIVLTGCVVADVGASLHFTVGEFCFSFLPEDIIDIEPPLSSELLPQEHAGTIRILIRRGARVQDIRPRKFCGQRLPGKRPFALSVRPPVITLGPCTRFRDLERKFLLTHALIDE